MNFLICPLTSDRTRLLSSRSLSIDYPGRCLEQKNRRRSETPSDCGRERRWASSGGRAHTHANRVRSNIVRRSFVFRRTRFVFERIAFCGTQRATLTHRPTEEQQPEEAASVQSPDNSRRTNHNGFSLLLNSKIMIMFFLVSFMYMAPRESTECAGHVLPRSALVVHTTSLALLRVPLGRSRLPFVLHKQTALA